MTSVRVRVCVGDVRSTSLPLTAPHLFEHTSVQLLLLCLSLRLLSSQRSLPHLSGRESAGRTPHATALWLTVEEVIL